MQRRENPTQSGTDLAAAIRKKKLDTGLPVSGRPATDFGASLPAYSSGMPRRNRMTKPAQ
jgi:hypothetical protein